MCGARIHESGVRIDMDKNDNGYIVVETVGAFVPFILLVISILSLVNIVSIQARLHYALTQAANTLSMYSYTLEVLGIANSLTTLDNKADKAKKEIDAVRADITEVIDGIKDLSEGNITGLISGKDEIRKFEGIEQVMGDPKEAVQLLMNYGLNELRNQVFEQMVRPLVGRYLSNGEITGNEYLIRGRVVNKKTDAKGLSALEFFKFSNEGIGNSVLIDKNGNVKLTVEYEIEYTFGGLPLPFKPTIKLTQTVITKAWLNGSGKGYW
jgi:hypothetical protein